MSTRPKLFQIATRHADPVDDRTRLANVYELYERYFEALRDEPVALLELGVHKGGSLKTWTEYFRHGTIVGVDALDPCADFSAYPNIRFELADQRDGGRLSHICRRHAPGGFDIIVDDASHIGTFTLMSYQALFPHLKPGGFYCVEDWATGYWSDWSDGAVFSPFDLQPPSDEIEKRIPTHDYGMVGFVKYMVDEVMSRGIRDSITAPLTRPDRLEFAHIYKAAVVLKKQALQNDGTLGSSENNAE
jgi:hypothetical protein